MCKPHKHAAIIKAWADGAKAVREGKVHTIIVPYDFKGIINAGK